MYRLCGNMLRRIMESNWRSLQSFKGWCAGAWLFPSSFSRSCKKWWTTWGQLRWTQRQQAKNRFVFGLKTWKMKKIQLVYHQFFQICKIFRFLPFFIVFFRWNSWTISKQLGSRDNIVLKCGVASAARAISPTTLKRPITGSSIGFFVLNCDI